MPDSEIQEMPWQKRLREGHEALTSNPAAFVATLCEALDKIGRLQAQLDQCRANAASADAMNKITVENANRLWADRDGLISRASQFQSQRDAAEHRARIAEQQVQALNNAIDDILRAEYRDQFPGVALVCALLKSKIVSLPTERSHGQIDRQHSPGLEQVIKG